MLQNARRARFRTKLPRLRGFEEHTASIESWGCCWLPAISPQRNVSLDAKPIMLKGPVSPQPKSSSTSW